MFVSSLSIGCSVNSVQRFHKVLQAEKRKKSKKQRLNAPFLPLLRPSSAVSQRKDATNGCKMSHAPRQPIKVDAEPDLAVRASSPADKSIQR
jgi:hypothetical protein